MTLTATYSPDDNKLRLYSSTRLDADTYKRVRLYGFQWAPKQQLFYAPAWTPQREDLLLELAGEIGDDDSSLTARAEERAERFEGYQANRAKDADRARAGVAAIVEHIPLGQPILVGHHSERHARADQKRIENGMRKAVKMWETSEYWAQRAAGALAHAKYKELPRVRANRIKTIEADKRRAQRSIKEIMDRRALWESCDSEAKARLFSQVHTVVIRNGNDTWCAWEILREIEGEGRAREGTPLMTWQQVREVLRTGGGATIAHYERWIAHYDNRLTYEKAMLAEQGESALLDKKPRRELLPLLNYRAPGGSITTKNPYRHNEPITYKQVEMTKAAYAAIWTDYKGTRHSLDNSHRFRTALVDCGGKGRDLCAVFLTDSKVHEIPKAEAKAPAPQPEPPAPPAPRPPAPRAAIPETPADIDAMRQALKTGVKVQAVPQLFPTPPELAARVVQLAEILPEHRVLEPSAGTGNLLRAIDAEAAAAGVGIPDKVAIEINAGLISNLARVGVSALKVYEADFLEALPGDFGDGFDRVIMNPPFENGADIKHIQHAAKFLKPGGRLVAICANGPRQAAALRAMAEDWIELPPGSFQSAGTNVNTAIVIIEREAA